MLTRQKLEHGFSLVEMAIVMLIIGLIVAAVTVGKSTIKSAETLKAYQKIVVPCVASVAEGIRNGATPVLPAIPTVKLEGDVISCTFTEDTVTVTGAPKDLKDLMRKNLDNGIDVTVSDAVVTLYSPDSGDDGSSSPSPLINVRWATYGGETCEQERGNVTSFIASACSGESTCNYLVDRTIIGDPAPGCAKDFRVRWKCGNEGRTASLGPEASGQTISLSCPPVPIDPNKINVRWATYGGETCEQERGNVTSFIASACSGESTCNYLVDHTIIGDPAPGCAKDFRVRWKCGTEKHTAKLSAEASGQTVSLACP